MLSCNGYFPIILESLKLKGFDNGLDNGMLLINVFVIQKTIIF